MEATKNLGCLICFAKTKPKKGEKKCQEPFLVSFFILRLNFLNFIYPIINTI